MALKELFKDTKESDDFIPEWRKTKDWRKTKKFGTIENLAPGLGEFRLAASPGTTLVPGDQRITLPVSSIIGVAGSPGGGTTTRILLIREIVTVAHSYEDVSAWFLANNLVQWILDTPSK